MREIEYRGQALRSKLWVRGYYWTNENGNHFIRQTVDLNGCFRIEDIEVDPETVGQYTGLKDKNLKKIYEGDIVKIDEDVRKIFDIKASIGVVTYFSGVFYIKVSNDFVDIIRTSLHCIQNIYYILRGEVIGNITDNKELLEE